MEHKYNLQNIFLNFLSLKGMPYILLPKPDRIAKGESYEPNSNNNMRDSELYQKGVFMPVKINNLLIPYAVISLSCSKNIIKTEMPGRTGTVKELISINDTEIEITGMLVGNDRLYPSEEVIEMRRLFEKNEAVDIECHLADMLLGADIKIVIEAMTFPPLKGVEDAQLITMKCITDLPFKLIL